MDRLAVVERALRSAAPHVLLDVVTQALLEQYRAERVELRLADYGISTRQVVEEVPFTTESVPIHDSPQGRAFGAQEPYAEPRIGHGPMTVHVPVTIRGDRMGVLSVTLPEDRCTEADRQEIQQVCEALGHEILVAERDTDAYLLARRDA